MLQVHAMRPSDDSREKVTVFVLAKRDHRRHVDLIERVQAEKGEARRARGMAQLAADLRRHMQAEHSALIGHLLADSTARPLARALVAEQQRLTRLVSDLPCRADDELELALALSTYRAAFLEYVRFEEEELYPAAMLALGRERCERLANEYRSATAEPLDYMLAR